MINKITQVSLLLILCLICKSQIAAQNSPPNYLRDLWLDKKITFLIPDTLNEDVAYSTWSTSRFYTIHPTAAEIMGKRGIIDDVKIGDSFDPVYITVRLIENDSLIYGFAFDGFLRNVIFEEEMRIAQQMKGAILWNKRSIFYRDASDEKLRTSVVVKNLEPMYINNIDISDNSGSAVRLHLTRVGGEKVYIDLNASDINLPIGGTPMYLDEVFHKDNPRMIFTTWKDKLWDQIEQEKIVKGMPQDAILLSWGEPDDIAPGDDENTEYWLYDNREPSVILRIEKGKLKSWQTR